ncbi:hypothetical protein GGD66_002684 [Bradyrhizobium sp. CIR48]|uniref:hypothetical protein n=1 Tax=Bradyrhizobium sp. CIR48 TaxID=2663840 RepID=UPI001605CCC0|nr:hypothetical protein [Bradyrhizobium sp. CIR48]MBB4424140.1 hypothetical protein [Bradyrhizobium sp. CIR48]
MSGFRQMPETLDGVVKIKPNDRGYYGFLHADGKTRDYYFTEGTVTNYDVPLVVGARVRFWYDRRRKMGEHTAWSKKNKSHGPTS